MNGRFIGAYLSHIYSPGKVLASAAAVAILLLAVAGADAGAFSGWAFSIGLSNSIIFPTIFTLASEGLGSRAHEGLGIICIAIVGRHRIYGSMACAAG